MPKGFVIFLLLAAIATTSAQQSRDLHFDGSSWWSHVKFLADDSLEGRDTGSEGLRKAEAYAVEQLEKAGFEPAGAHGFYQSIHFRQYRIVESKSSLALVYGGQTKHLSFSGDAYFSPRLTHASAAVSAPLVFVGYGLQIPEKNLDELAGLDLNGKIAVYLAGSPADIPSALAAHYQTIGERWRALHEAGAVGWIAIPNPASMDVPWSRMSANHDQPAMDLADPEFNETQGLDVGIVFNPASAEPLFAGSGHTFADLAALAKDRKPLPHFGLETSLQAAASVESKNITSDNVIAKLPGNDPSLKNEFVVLSAHVDHIGIGAPINGDRIYNGAMDNASGSALVLDMAADLKAHPETLKRSVLFILFTAEEKGLLGAKYFNAHPTVPHKSMVADINIDMFLPIAPLKVLRVQGLADSDLGDRAVSVAKSLGVKAVPDPEPLRNLFIRSDQYYFIRHGIPSVIMDVFYAPGSPEQKLFKDWLTERYHAPSDDANQPVDLKAAAVYEEIVRRLLIGTANASAAPQWKPESFFSRYTEK
jgi:Zn-dependent M28 family amino/carboxypeptidase